MSINLVCAFLSSGFARISLSHSHWTINSSTHFALTRFLCQNTRLPWAAQLYKTQWRKGLFRGKSQRMKNEISFFFFCLRPWYLWVINISQAWEQGRARESSVDCVQKRRRRGRNEEVKEGENGIAPSSWEPQPPQGTIIICSQYSVWFLKKHRKRETSQWDQQKETI